MAVTAALGGHADQRPLILAGDLNDTAQAATSQLLLGPPGSEIGTRGFDQHDNGDPMRLWNLAPIMPPGRDYSRINQGRKELIDHILASQALVQPLNTVTAQAVIDAPLASIDPTDPTARRNAPPPTTPPSQPPSPIYEPTTVPPSIWVHPVPRAECGRRGCPEPSVCRSRPVWSRPTVPGPVPRLDSRDDRLIVVAGTDAAGIGPARRGRFDHVGLSSMAKVPASRGFGGWSGA